MVGRIDTFLMCVKFGDDPICTLDFSFIGGSVPLNYPVKTREIELSHEKGG